MAKKIIIRNTKTTKAYEAKGNAVVIATTKAINGLHNHNKTRCSCVECVKLDRKDRKIILPDEGYPVYTTINGRGTEAYIHPSHVADIKPYHYYKTHGLTPWKVGRPTFEGKEVSTEIEVVWAENATPEAKACVLEYMRSHNYKAERDCTVSVEFIGVINNSLNGLAEVFQVLSVFVNAKIIKFNSRCGMHLNVSTDSLRNYFPRFSRSKMHSYLQESNRYIVDHRDDIEATFGRVDMDYIEYANPERGTDGHGCALNKAHLFEDNGETVESCRMEYRIAKWNGNGEDANRYMEMAKRLVEYTDALMNAVENNLPYSVGYDLMAKVMKVVEV